MAGARVCIVEPDRWWEGIPERRVFADRLTDADGRFVLEVDPERFLEERVAKTVLVMAANHELTGSAIDPCWLTEEEGREFVLPGCTPWTLEVLDEAGKPLSGVLVLPRWVRQGSWSTELPEELARTLGLRTDERGIATFDWVSREDMRQLIFVNELSGELQCQLADDWGDLPAKVRFHDVSMLRGRLLLPPEETVDGWRVVAEIPDQKGHPTSAFALLVEAQGALAAPCIYKEGTSLSFVVPPNALSLPLHPLPKGVTGVCGTLGPDFVGRDLPTDPTREYEGTVVDASSGEGVPGAVLVLRGTAYAGPSVYMRVETNPRGVFRFRSVPRTDVRASILHIPPPFVELSTEEDAFLPPEERSRNQSLPVDLPEDDSVLPPIRVQRGLLVRGAVRDVDGSAAAAAHVMGFGTVTLPGDNQTFSTGAAWSDEHGEFWFALHPETRNIRVDASKNGNTSARVAFVPEKSDPLLLTLAGAISLTGRIVDSSGRAVPGVTVTIEDFLGRRSSKGSRSDGEGVFRTPFVYRQAERYRFRLEGPEVLSVQTPLLEHEEGRVHDLLVQCLGRVAGRVADARGQPIAGACVFHLGDLEEELETTCDAAGEFSLVGVDLSLPLVFAEAPGYVLGGALVLAGERAAIELRSNDAPPRAGMAWQHLPSLADRQALAHAVLEPWRAQVEASGPIEQRLSYIRTLAIVAPAEAARLLDATAGVSLEALANLRCAIVERARSQDLGFVPAGEVWAHPAWGMSAALLEFERSPTSERFSAACGALASLTSTEEHTLYGIELARVALGVGCDLEASDLLAAVIEREEGSTPASLDALRHCIATVLACSDMGAAFRAWKGLSAPTTLEDRRRAAKDCLHARGILEQLEEARRQMNAPDDGRSSRIGAATQAADLALALPYDERDLAREVVEEALQWTIARSPRWERRYRCSTAAELLRHVDLVLSERSDEQLWRCLALRRVDPWQALARFDEDAGIARSIARHQPELARTLLDRLARYMVPACEESEWLFHQEHGETAEWSTLDLPASAWRMILAARAVLDPEAAVALLDERFDRSTAPMLRATVAQALCDPDFRDDPPQRFKPLGR